MFKRNPSMCCRWGWQTPVWLWGPEVVPRLVPRLESPWAIFSAAQSSQNCCFNADKGILILSRSIYLPQRSFFSPTHHRHVTQRKGLPWSLFSLVVLPRPGLRPFQCILEKTGTLMSQLVQVHLNPNFLHISFYIKKTLQEFRAVKIAE